MKITNSNFNNLNQIDKNNTGTKNALAKIAAAKSIEATDSASREIANALSSQANVIDQGILNANDAIGILQIADGAAQQMSQNATKLQELSVRYNNDALGSNSKKALEREFQGITKSIEDISNNTTYNSKPVFDENMQFSTSQGMITLNAHSANTSSLNINDIDSIQSFQNQISQTLSDIGSASNFAQTSINNMLSTSVNLKEASSNISEKPLDEIMNEFKSNETKLTASILAQAHNTDRLRKQMNTLLGA